MAGFWHRLLGHSPAAHAIPDALWRATLTHYPFLARMPEADAQHLRTLSGLFLARKQFTGAHGFTITDAMALAIAAQACLPLLHWGEPAQTLRYWYGDFVGIVVHAGEVLARRETTDDAGVVHHYGEVLAGEAMERGPVMLSWQDVADAGVHGGSAYSVVLHEFAHKIDMRDGAADGCPLLPPGFLGTHGGRAARQAWFAVLKPAYQAFREQAIIAERFSGPVPWLDLYGAQSPAEFFAVACEAYFVDRERFRAELPTILVLFDAFFRPR